MPNYYFINDHFGENYVLDILSKEMKSNVTIFTNNINFIDDNVEDERIFFRSDSGIFSDTMLLRHFIEEIDNEFKEYLDNCLYYLYNSSSKYKSQTKKAFGKLSSKNSSSEEDIESWLNINQFTHPKKILFLTINDNHRDTPTFISILTNLLIKSSIPKYNIDILLLSNSMLKKNTYYHIDYFNIHFNQTDYLIDDILRKIDLPKNINLSNSGVFQQISKVNGKFFFNNVYQKEKIIKSDDYYMDDYILIL